MAPIIINNQQLLESIKGYLDKERSTREEVFVSGLTSDFANASFKDVKWHHKSTSCKHLYRVALVNDQWSSQSTDSKIITLYFQKGAQVSPLHWPSSGHLNFGEGGIV